MTHSAMGAIKVLFNPSPPPHASEYFPPLKLLAQLHRCIEFTLIHKIKSKKIVPVSTASRNFSKFKM